MYEPVVSTSHKTKEPTTVPSYSDYDPMIPKTNPVSVSELGTHISKCHLDGDELFEEQYKVMY